MKWEYLVLPIADSEIANQIKLMQHLSDATAIHYPTINELGSEGWELVSVDNGIAYFKRISKEYLEEQAELWKKRIKPGL